MLLGDIIEVKTNFGAGEVDLDIRPRLKEIFPISNPPLGSNNHDESLYSLLLEENSRYPLLLSSIALYYEQLATKKNPLHKRSLRLNWSYILRLQS